MDEERMERKQAHLRIEHVRFNGRDEEIHFHEHPKGMKEEKVEGMGMRVKRK